MKYPKAMYIDSQIFGGDRDGIQLDRKNRKDKNSSFVLYMRKTYTQR
mgnify:CR=1 FL=1